MLGDNETALSMLEKTIHAAFGPSVVLGVNLEFDSFKGQFRILGNTLS